ncbi:MAG: YqiA/YcfP family alpha/beta fold hydrolase [Polyangiaceae bacterium]
MSVPRWLYLHGFASSPESAKAQLFAGAFRTRKVELKRLDMRQPSMEALSFSAMTEHVREQIGTERDRVVLIGSSLGGLCAARVAEQDPRVCALFLLAPAFRLVPRWRARLGEAAWSEWQKTGSLEVDDYAHGGKVRVPYEFAAELSRMDAADGGYPDVRVPTCIVHGVRDDVVDTEAVTRFAAGKPHVELHLVDDGHDLLKTQHLVMAHFERFARPFFVGQPQALRQTLQG